MSDFTLFLEIILLILQKNNEDAMVFDKNFLVSVRLLSRVKPGSADYGRNCRWKGILCEHFLFLYWKWFSPSPFFILVHGKLPNYHDIIIHFSDTKDNCNGEWSAVGASFVLPHIWDGFEPSPFPISTYLTILTLPINIVWQKK